ncbi:hypothetical protein [Clostridium perfringens]|uniref:Preprotein translocase subunit SecB n=1 Tax=Clostridium perfringens TaxID=1502 RepID=A0A133MRQ7_CLOPF|nr:hypothetical protein [Clostridium perfringens]KXA06738.1 hypothetical protein HMPREF3222_02902 [Clostridium perfringens]MBS5919842.1 hypothetical protein [Clostridium perfringens]MDK0980595.1 hypothetical protein [Clostridium perfringens]MDU3845662.1 hypothetical protein [Clostridium perfringens]MDU7066946.1 hypothetical protein [Clostridium perfringens]
MNNRIIDTQFFMENMEIERIVNDVKAGDINYELNLQYYIHDINENTVALKVKCDSGFKPSLMFIAKFRYNVIVEFENDITDDEVYKNINDILDSIGSEISCLISILTRSMGGSPLIVPPVVNKISRLDDCN